VPVWETSGEMRVWVKFSILGNHLLAWQSLRRPTHGKISKYISEAIFKNLRRPRAQHRVPHDHSSNFLAFRTSLDIVYDAVRPVAGSTIPGSFPSQISLAHISARSVLVLSISPAYKYAPSGLVEARQRRIVSHFFFSFRVISLSPDRQGDESEPAAPSTRLPVLWSFLFLVALLAIARPSSPSSALSRLQLTRIRAFSPIRERGSISYKPSTSISELTRRDSTYVTRPSDFSDTL
jgi:hypothetical protein